MEEWEGALGPSAFWGVILALAPVMAKPAFVKSRCSSGSARSKVNLHQRSNTSNHLGLSGTKIPSPKHTPSNLLCCLVNSIFITQFIAAPALSATPSTGNSWLLSSSLSAMRPQLQPAIAVPVPLPLMQVPRVMKLPCPNFEKVSLSPWQAPQKLTFGDQGSYTYYF